MESWGPAGGGGTKSLSLVGCICSRVLSVASDGGATPFDESRRNAFLSWASSTFLSAALTVASGDWNVGMSPLRWA